MPNNTYQSEFTGPQMDERFAAVPGMQAAITEIQAALANRYTKGEVDAMIATLNAMEYVDVASLPDASASTMGKIYLVGPDGSGYYSYYISSYDDTDYSWVGPLGTTEISLANYATKAELNQLDQELLENNKNYSRREGDFSAIQYYKIKNDGTYGTDNTLKHADMLVWPGEVVVVTANNSEAATICFVSDINMPNSGATYGLVANTFTEIAAGTSKQIIVPSGAVAMKVYLGKLTDDAYPYKPTSLYIYRAKGLTATPQPIKMDKCSVSSHNFSYNSVAHGFAYPVEKGKTYRLKVTGAAATGTKYSVLTEGLPYRLRYCDYSTRPSSTFTAQNVVITRKSNVDGVWSIFQGVDATFTVSFEEVDSTFIDDADTFATARMLDYESLDIAAMPHLGYYIVPDTGLWKSSSANQSLMYPVTPGQLIKIVPKTGTPSVIQWLASDAAPVADGLPNSPVGHIELISVESESILRVPTGASFVYIRAGEADAELPEYFGIANNNTPIPPDTEHPRDNVVVSDFCAYNDKQLILAQNRSYYFNDTYGDEVSFVDTSYLDRKVMSVPDGKHFIFFTDSHIDYSNNIGIRQQQTAVVKYVRDRLGIKNVIFGGDAIGNTRPVYTAAKILSIYAKELFEAFGSDMLFVIGNHDANHPNSDSDYGYIIPDTEIYKRTTKNMKDYGKAVFPTKLIDIIDTSDDLVDNAGNAMTSDEKEEYKAWAMQNYYYDDDQQGIRYIVLETGNCGSTLHSMFGANGDSQNSLMTVAYFLVQAMQTIPEGYDLVVVGHWLISNGAFWKRVFYRLLAAYKNKASVDMNFTPFTYQHPAVQPIVSKTFDNPESLSSVNVNFKYNAGSGRVFTLGGHVHYDEARIKAYVSDNDDISTESFPLTTEAQAQSLTYTENSILQIVCDRCCAIGKGSSVPETGFSFPNDSSYTSVESGGVDRLGTVKEVLFDVVTLTDDNRVVLTRFGAEGDVDGSPYVRNYVLPMRDDS